MENTVKTTENNTLPKLTQQNIPEMLAKVKEQIAAMSKKKEGQQKTKSSLEGFGKIDDIKEVSTLIKAHSAVVNRAAAYKVSAESGIIPDNVKVPTFKIGGHTESQWVDHITTRVAEVANKKQLDGLKEFRDTLEENLSVEMKLASKLAKIQANIDNWE